MDAAVQATLGAVLREHRAQMPRDLWQAVCMKCMLTVAESIDRMQHALRAAQKSAQRSAERSAADGASCAPTGSAARGAGAAADGGKPGAEEAQVPTGEGLDWELLDQAMLATMQLRLRAYHHVLHESAPVVSSPLDHSSTTDERLL